MNPAVIELKCYSCGKVFKFKSHYERHKSKKTPCLIREIAPHGINNPNRCIFCNKIFSTKGNHAKHMAKCKIRNGGMEILADKVKHEQEIRILKEKDAQREEKINQIETVNKQMQEQIAQLQDQLKQTIQPTINNTNNIVINNYLTPSLKHLRLEDGINSPISKLIYMKRIQTPMFLIPLIWFNEAAPENFSIYLVNKNTKEVLIYDGGDWESNTFLDVSKNIRNYAYEITQNIIKGGAVCPRLDQMVSDNMHKNIFDEGVIKYECENIYKSLVGGRALVKKYVKN